MQDFNGGGTPILVTPHMVVAPILVLVPKPPEPSLVVSSRETSSPSSHGAMVSNCDRASYRVPRLQCARSTWLRHLPGSPYPRVRSYSISGQTADVGMLWEKADSKTIVEVSQRTLSPALKQTRPHIREKLLSPDIVVKINRHLGIWLVQHTTGHG